MNQNRLTDRAARGELAQLFSALSHPHRIHIVQILAQGERDVNTLSELLGCTQSRVSQQLALLRARNLVHVRRDGRHAYYRLSHGSLNDLIERAGGTVEELLDLHDLLPQSPRG
jgi:DNA-binding transcriptional ArsR family regulator